MSFFRVKSWAPSVCLFSPNWMRRWLFCCISFQLTSMTTNVAETRLGLRRLRDVHTGDFWCIKRTWKRDWMRRWFYMTRCSWCRDFWSNRTYCRTTHTHGRTHTQTHTHTHTLHTANSANKLHHTHTHKHTHTNTHTQTLTHTHTYLYNKHTRIHRQTPHSIECGVCLCQLVVVLSAI